MCDCFASHTFDEILVKLDSIVATCTRRKPSVKVEFSKGMQMLDIHTRPRFLHDLNGPFNFTVVIFLLFRKRHQIFVPRCIEGRHAAERSSKRPLQNFPTISARAGYWVQKTDPVLPLTSQSFLVCFMWGLGRFCGEQRISPW